MKKFILFAILACATFFNSAQATVIGDSSNAAAVQNSCLPFGCAIGDGEYEQMYLAQNYASTSYNILGASFATNFQPDTTRPTVSVSSGIFTISLAWTAASDFNDNRPSFNEQVVFRGELPAIQNWSWYEINFDKSYYYDASTGNNLLMKVKWENAAPTGSPLYFVSGTGMPSRGSMPNYNDYSRDYGMVTDLHAVPEPSSLALIGLSLFGLGVRRRVRK